MTYEWFIIAVLLLINLFCLCRCVNKTDGFNSSMIKKLSRYDGRMPGTLAHYNSYLFLLDRVKTLNNIIEVPWARDYTQPYTHKGVAHQNIVFAIKGRNSSSGKNIIIMAHYDHIGPGFPGSNDNGSGVYGLLCVAKHMSVSSLTKTPKYNIIFALTDGEEKDQSGSAILSELLGSGNIVINIDTIGGYPSESPIFIANDHNFVEYFRMRAIKNNLNIKLIPIMPGRSDINNFIHDRTNTCVEFGFPLGEYHTHLDTYENLNVGNMNIIIDLAIGLVEHISYPPAHARPDPSDL